jgi:hypothetical protein
LDESSPTETPPQGWGNNSHLRSRLGRSTKPVSAYCGAARVCVKGGCGKSSRLVRREGGQSCFGIVPPLLYRLFVDDQRVGRFVESPDPGTMGSGSRYRGSGTCSDLIGTPPFGGINPPRQPQLTHSRAKVHVNKGDAVRDSQMVDARHARR